MNYRYLLPVSKYVSKKIVSKKGSDKLATLDIIKIGLSLFIDLIMWLLIILFILFIVVPILFFVLIIVLVLAFLFVVLFLISCVIVLAVIIISLPWFIIFLPCIIIACCLQCCTLVLEDMSAA